LGNAAIAGINAYNAQSGQQAAPTVTGQITGANGAPGFQYSDGVQTFALQDGGASGTDGLPGSFADSGSTRIQPEDSEGKSDVLEIDGKKTTVTGSQALALLQQAQGADAAANNGLAWRFGSPGDAVKYFSSIANPITSSTGMEVGAWVLHDAGGYYTSSYQSTGAYGVDLGLIDQSRLPDGTTVVAWTHTHPDDYNFSGSDIYWNKGLNNGNGGYTTLYGDVGFSVDKAQVDAYVSLHNGDIYKFDYKAFVAAQQSGQWTVYAKDYFKPIH